MVEPYIPQVGIPQVGIPGADSPQVQPTRVNNHFTQFPSPGLLSQPPPNYLQGVVAKLKARNYQMECEPRSLKDDYAKAIDDCVSLRQKSSLKLPVRTQPLSTSKLVRMI